MCCEGSGPRCIAGPAQGLQGAGECGVELGRVLGRGGGWAKWGGSELGQMWSSGQNPLPKF